VVGKFIVPALWLVAGIAASIWYLRLPASDRPDPSFPIQWIVLVWWLIVGIVVLWTAKLIKKVTIDGKDLIVSNYFREVRIPFGNISRVSQSKALREKMVRIDFNIPTPFGRNIRFVPGMSFTLPWKEHPIVAELRGLSRIS
jgi:hypothetical protein